MKRSSLGRSSGRPSKNYGQYRCVYCKRRLLSAQDVKPHERYCEMRKLVEAQWAEDIRKARRKENFNNNGS